MMDSTDFDLDSDLETESWLSSGTNNDVGSMEFAGSGGRSDMEYAGGGNGNGRQGLSSRLESEAARLGWLVLCLRSE